MKKNLKHFNYSQRITFVLSVFCVTLSSCNSDYLFSFDDFEEKGASDFSPEFQQVLKESKPILSSNEFRDYMTAVIEFGDLFLNKDSSNMVYVDSLQMYGIPLLTSQEKVEELYAKLLEKFPSYEGMSIEVKNFMKMSAISQIKGTDYSSNSTLASSSQKVLTRSINNNPESSIAHSIFSGGSYGNRFTITPYVSCYDAVEECKRYSKESGVESGGMFFVDSSGFFIKDTQATSSSMRLPILSWGDNGPTLAFHYHFHSSQLSPDDIAAQEPLGCTIHVIYNDTLY